MACFKIIFFEPCACVKRILPCNATKKRSRTTPLPSFECQDNRTWKNTTSFKNKKTHPKKRLYTLHSPHHRTR